MPYISKENLFRRILQILFFLSLLSPLVFYRKLFFPYVTSSALFFRLIVETLFFFWIIYILLYPRTLKGLFLGRKEEKGAGQQSGNFSDSKQGVGVFPSARPKFNLLGLSFFIYLLVLAASAIFGANLYFSFWGDAERMMGIFGLVHFFILFLVGVSIFREKKELNFLLNIFLAASTAAALYGFLQRLGLTSISPGEQRIFAMLGNASALAAYLIFGLGFSAYLFLKSQKQLWRIIYGISFFIHIFAIFLTGTRGAFFGVAVGLLFAFFVFLKSVKNKKLNRGLILGLIILVVIYGLIYFSQNQNWVKNNPSLYRLVHFSLSDSTIQGRLISWKAGLLGFKDKPLLGWGYEGFAAPFNKYFDAKYYNYAAEEYFDRAHNILIEHLATTGILGLAAYIFFLSTVFYFLIKIFKKEGDFIFFGVFGGLFIAYFAQNLFLFDSLPALIGFSVLLVVISKYYGGFGQPGVSNPKNRSLKLRPAFVFLAGIFLTIIFVFSLNNFIIKPFKALKDTVSAQIFLSLPYKEPEQAYMIGMRYLKKSVSYNTFLDPDLRTEAANTIYNYYTNVAKNPNQKFDLDFAILQHKKNLRYLPNDTYYNYKLAEALNFRYATDLDERFRDEAKIYIDKAIATSPQRVTLYYVLMENLVMEGKFQDAITTIQKAIDLNDQMPESYWELTKAYFENQDFDKAKENLIKTINMGYHISDQNLEKFQALFNVINSREGEIQYLELAVKNGTTNYLYYSTLATRYYQMGQYEKAIFYAEKSAELNPSTRDKVDKFIERARELMNQNK